MAKFYGYVGYGQSVETAPGVFRDQIIERKYYGDIRKPNRQLQAGDKLNDDISTNNIISIVADPYAFQHFFAIRYVEWAGALWKVSDVTIASPRLNLQLGGVYNGPRADPKPR